MGGVNCQASGMRSDDTAVMQVDPPILGYYGRGKEQGRLFEEPQGVLERLRTWDLLDRFLPPGGKVLDIGGGAGVHARWLAERGYDVEMFDPVPLHLEQATQTATTLPQSRRFVVESADARDIPRPNMYADIVLLLGPLYHLVEATDRRSALEEARRLLRPGGYLAVAGISRFAWLMDAYRQQLASEPEIHETIIYSLETGRSVAQPGPASFWAHFHRPDELKAEISASGFHDVALCGIEGFAWLLPDLDEVLALESTQDRLLALLRKVETEPSVVGVSTHLLAMARASNR